MNKELHLIVLWQNSRHKEKEILEDIQKNLKIVECIEIEWTPDKVAKNFSRFYGQKLPSRSFKEKECGRGKFLLITLFDENPKYEFVETSRGFEKVNTNMFYLKDKYRSWTGGGSKIHGTNNPAETNHDITLLLGKNYEDYLSQAPKSWDGNYRQLKKDVTGSDGWKDLEEFFYTLNATINYCVLRNYEILPEQFRSDLHGDIDVLTDNYNDLVYLTNASPVYKQPYRVHHKVKIGGKDVLFDFRFVGDNYYCYDFEENILKNRILNDKNIYTPNKENAFYSLIYHCIVHKKVIAADYYEKAKKLYDALDLDKKELDKYEFPFDYYYGLLNDFIKRNSYFYIKPNDHSVFYNKKHLSVEKIIKWLETSYNIKDIRPYMIGTSLSEYLFFTGTLDGNKLFIKWGGLGRAVQTEYKGAKKLYSQNNENFAKPYLYNCNNGKNFVALEYIEGTMLNKIMQNDNLSEEQIDSYTEQLEKIALEFEKAEYIHRDIRPANIMVTDDGTLKLIDMQFCVNLKPFKVTRDLIKYWSTIANLGEKYSVGMYCWDDMYSINKVINELGRHSKKVKSLIGKYRLNLSFLKIPYFIIKAPRFIYKKFLKK
ncbi:MAG: protein kinase [bacterium]|nr:protein kinase [bacterium]